MAARACVSRLDAGAAPVDRRRGTFFAARAIGVGWIAASAAGVAVMLGGSVSGWIHGGHLLLIYSAAWVPWALGLAIVSVRSGRAFPDGRLVAVVLQFLTGYLQGTLYLAAVARGRVLCFLVAVATVSGRCSRHERAAMGAAHAIGVARACCVRRGGVSVAADGGAGCRGRPQRRAAVP